MYIIERHTYIHIVRGHGLAFIDRHAAASKAYAASACRNGPLWRFTARMMLLGRAIDRCRPRAADDDERRCRQIV